MRRSRSPVGNAVVPCTAQAGRWILTAAIFGSSMAFIDSTVVNVALPALQASLHATVVGVQWVVESYGLFLGALILVGGSLGDLFGRRLIFLIGVGLFAAASIACGLASNIQQLVVARSVQGIGAAFLVPGSLQNTASQTLQASVTQHIAHARSLRCSRLLPILAPESLGAHFSLFRGNLPRPESWLPYVYTSPEEAAESGICVVNP